jgi:hypothetical protein
MSITVTGTVDIASHTATPSRGAGSEPVGSVRCAYGIGPGNGSNPETRGGAGGSFGGTGGYGGLRNNQPPATDSGVPGTVVPLPAPQALRGGCRGQDGYMTGAIGGFGGGGIYLAAGNSISVEAGGAINASGAGGNGGAMPARGGAGAGSGGMIVLDAMTVSVLGRVFADGGGGGEGSGNNNDGNYGYESDGTSRAQGGNGNAVGGSDGGPGSYGMMVNGGDGGNDGADSGGGGGGGAGLIWIHAQGGTRSGPISPTAIAI